jgi:hypothetical protein
VAEVRTRWLELDDGYWSCLGVGEESGFVIHRFGGVPGPAPPMGGLPKNRVECVLVC